MTDAGKLWKWTHVSEQLPRIGQMVLVAWREGDVWRENTAYYEPVPMQDRRAFIESWGEYAEIPATHWMPMPPHPRDVQ